MFVLPYMLITGKFKDAVGCARSTMHSNVRDACVPLGMHFIQEECDQNNTIDESDIWRGARERIRRMEPYDKASFLSPCSRSTLPTPMNTHTFFRFR